MIIIKKNTNLTFFIFYKQYKFLLMSQLINQSIKHKTYRIRKWENSTKKKESGKSTMTCLPFSTYWLHHAAATSLDHGYEKWNILKQHVNTGSRGIIICKISSSLWIIWLGYSYWDVDSQYPEISILNLNYY